MTDYNYSDNRVELSDTTSGNRATGLGGYPLDVRPDGSWPGTSANPNQLRADTDRMNAVADRIDAMVSTLTNSGLVQEVSTKSGAARYGPDSWQAASYLKDATGQVAQAVSSYGQELITNLQGASAAIRRATASVAGGEQANVTTANNQQDQIDSTSSSGY